MMVKCSIIEYLKSNKTYRFFKKDSENEMVHACHKLLELHAINGNLTWQCAEKYSYRVLEQK